MQGDSTVWMPSSRLRGLFSLIPMMTCHIWLASSPNVALKRPLILAATPDGTSSILLGQRGFTMHGIDSAPTGLVATQQGLQHAGLTAHLLQHDVFDRLPFGEAFFDAILSVQVIHHARKAQICALVDEITRVLKPNGLLFVTVPQL